MYDIVLKNCDFILGIGIGSVIGALIGNIFYTCILVL